MSEHAGSGPAPVKAVLFDLFETLITEFRAGGQAPRTWERLGVPETEWRDAWRRGRPARMRGEIPDYATALRVVCGDLGFAPDEAVVADLLRERLERKRRPFRTIEPPVLEMVAALGQVGLGLGVVSNASVEEVAGWDGSALADLFDDPVFSYRVGCAKPEPEIYEIALGRVGTRPEETLFVGDGGSRELVGAREAGLRPVWATWFLERCPPGWMEHAAPGARGFPRCREPAELVALVRALSAGSERRS